MQFDFIIPNRTKNNLLQYLLQYNVNSIKIDTYNLNKLYNITTQSPFNTQYTNEIRNIGNKIKNNKHAQSISRYINDYEFIDFIAENSSQYNRAYYKITEILLDNPLLQKNNLKLLGLAEAPGNFIRYIKNIIHSTNPSWDNYDIITLLTHDELVSQQNFPHRI